MTSKLTREKAQWLHDACEEAAAAGIKLTMNPNELLMFTSYVLAAMDSEPVFTLQISQADYKGQKLGNHFGFITLDAARELDEGNYPLYRHAQPAPVVQCPYPCGWDNLNKLAIQDAAFVARGLAEGEPVTESLRQAAISNNDRLLKVISACRAAMLQELQKKCRSIE